MARFDREAKLLASLNHSNIAAIYGLEQAKRNDSLYWSLSRVKRLRKESVKERCRLKQLWQYAARSPTDSKPHTKKE